MAGFTACLVDRGLVGTWSIKVGSAVTGYPIANLNDWRASNQTRVTKSTTTVRIMVELPAAPSGSTNTDWHINCLGIINHNLDGGSIAVKSHTSDDFANGTSRLAATALDASMGNPNLLVTWTASAARYWYLDITNVATDPVQIGRIVFGYAFDFGFPVEAWPLNFQQTANVATTATGNQIGGRYTSPIKTTQVRFQEQASVTRHVVHNPAVTTATTFPTYANVERFFTTAKQTAINAPTVVTGITAGAGIPMPYHRGSVIGLSGAGRPAYCGIISLDTVAMQEVPTAAPITLTIQDCNDANNRIVQPPTN